MEYCWDYQIQLRDTDAAGVVYFANFLTICHAAYEASLSAAGIDLRLLVNGSSEIALPITHVSGDFKKPLYCGDQIQVLLTSSQLNDSEFQIDYRLCLANGKIAGIVQTKHVAIGLIDSHSETLRERQRVNLPDQIQRWLSS
jgi:1,4-dihydroxy-2-naphthoyl-CoA hydrolase